jgi:hypothetical protein
MVLSKSALEGWLVKELDKATFSLPSRVTAEGPSLAPPRRSCSPSPPPPGEIFQVSDASRDNSNTQNQLNETPSHTDDRIVCTHGLLDPEASANMKRISLVCYFLPFRLNRYMFLFRVHGRIFRKLESMPKPSNQTGSVKIARHLYLMVCLYGIWVS